MNNDNSKLQIAFELLDENCKMKIQELLDKVEDVRNCIQYIEYKIIRLNSKLIKLDEDIIKYKNGIQQRKNNLNNKDTVSNNITIVENVNKKFIQDLQNKNKNAVINNILLSQKEKEEKNTNNLEQEIVELDVEKKSYEWEYQEIIKSYQNLQNSINKYKISTENMEFENIEELKPFLI